MEILESSWIVSRCGARCGASGFYTRQECLGGAEVENGY